MWSNKYIGIPFKDGGRDTNGIDCWGLARLVYKQEYNIGLPSFNDQYIVTDHDRVAELFSRYREGWTKLDTPEEGALVAFNMFGSQTHVGIITPEKNSFLHVRENQDSVIERLDSTHWNKRVFGYYKYNENTSSILTVAPHPLKTQAYVLPVAPGTTLQEVADNIVETWKINKELETNLIIIVNGQIIEKHLWPGLVLASEDKIEVRSVAKGGGGGGLRLLLLLAVAIAAPYVATFIGQAMGVATAGVAMTGANVAFFSTQTLLGSVLTAGVSIIGGALVNAIAPIRPPKNEMKDPGQAEQQMILSGAQNRPNAYEAIPIILGRMRVTPPLAAQNFTIFQNERDSYLNMLLCWGYGPLHIERVSGSPTTYDFKIGNLDLSQFTQVRKQQTLERKFTPGGNLDNTALEIQGLKDIYPGDISQRWEQKVLEWDDGNPGQYPSNRFSGIPVSGTSGHPNVIQYSFPVKTGGEKDYTRVHMVLHYPQGLRKVRVKPSDPKTGAGVGDQFSLNGEEVCIRWQISPDGGVWTDLYDLNTIGQGSPKKDAFSVTYEKVFEDGSPYRRGPIFLRAWRYNWSGNDPVSADGSTSAFRYYHAVQLLNYTAFTQQDPWKDPPNCKLALSAFELKADKVLNGQVEGVNAIVQTYGFNYNHSTNTWLPGLIDNPAALFIYLITHPANPRRACNLLDSSGNFNTTEIEKYVNLEKIQEWYRYCDGTLDNSSVTMTSTTYTGSDSTLSSTPMVSVQYKKNGVAVGSPVIRPKFKFNAVVATQRSVLEVLRDVCAAGRGSPALIDGKWTVTYDSYTSTIVQHFSPHNTWGFESTRVLTELPHAVRVTYNDDRPLYDYKEVENVVFNAGYNQDGSGGKKEATLFESFPLPGITNNLLVYDHAKWHLAQAILRRELYTINTDIEYLVCNRGDRVRVTHDVPMWGIHTARVKLRIPENGNGAPASTLYPSPPAHVASLNTIGIDLTEEFQIDTLKNYSVKIRSGNNKGKESERTIKKTGFTVNKIIRKDGIVTLFFANPYHPFKRGNVFILTGTTGGANCDSSGLDEVLNEVMYADSDLCYIQFASSGPNGVWTGSFNVDLASNWYSKVIFTTPIGSTGGIVDCEEDDLVLFGYTDMVSNDLLVVSVEPTNNKQARINLVDYAEDIYWTYPSLSGTDLFKTNVTPGTRVDSGWNIQEVPYVTSVISDDSVADLISDGTYRYKIRISFSLFGKDTSKLSTGITHVQCQYGLDQRSNAIVPIPWIANNITGKDYPNSTSGSPGVAAGDPSESNLTIVEVPITQNYIDIPDVKQGEIWKFRLRFKADTGATGIWTPLPVNGTNYWYVHKVQGKDKNYNEVAEIRVRRIGKFLELNPILNPLPADFSHFEIRIYKNDGFSAIQGAGIAGAYSGKDPVNFNGAYIATTEPDTLDFWPADDLLPVAGPEVKKVHRYISSALDANGVRTNFVDNPWLKVVETTGLTQFDLTTFDTSLTGARITIPGVKYRILCRAVDYLGNYSRKIVVSAANQTNNPTVATGTPGDLGTPNEGTVLITSDGYEFSTATNSITLDTISPGTNSISVGARGFELEVASPRDTETTKLLQVNGSFVNNSIDVPRDDYKKLKVWISDYPNPRIYDTATNTNNIYNAATSDPRYSYGTQFNQLKLPGDLASLPVTHCATKTATFTAQSDTPGTASKNIVITGVVGTVELGAILVNVGTTTFSATNAVAPYGRILNRPGIWISIISQTSGTTGKDGTYVISEFQNIPAGTSLKTIPNIIYDSEDLSPSIVGLQPERQYYIRYALMSALAPDPTPPDYLDAAETITKNEDINFSSAISVVPDNSIEEIDTAFPPDVGTDGQVITLTTALETIFIQLSKNPQYGSGLTSLNNSTLPQYYGAYGTGVDDDGKFVPGKEYVVVSLGTTNWHHVAGTTTQTHPQYAIGSTFVAKEFGSPTTGTGKAQRLDSISSSHADTLVFMAEVKFPTSQYGEPIWEDVKDKIIARIPNNTLNYTLPAEPGKYYKLWFKYESRAGVQSRNPYGPLIAQTGQDAGKWLSILTEQISQGQLYKTFNSRVDAVDRGDKPIATKVELLDNQFSVKIDNGGHVSGFGLSSTGNGADKAISEFGVRASRFWIAAPSVISDTEPPVATWFPGKVWVDTSLTVNGGDEVDGVDFYYNTYKPDVHNKTIYPTVSSFQYWEQVSSAWLNTRTTFKWQGLYNYQTIYSVGDLVLWSDGTTDRTYKYIHTTPTSGATWQYVGNNVANLAGHRPNINTTLWQLVSHTSPITSTADNTSLPLRTNVETPNTPTFNTGNPNQVLSDVISTATGNLESGSFNITWKDIWQPDKTYSIDDVVRIGQDIFICKIAYTPTKLTGVKTVLNTTTGTTDTDNSNLSSQPHINLANPGSTVPGSTSQQKILNAGLFEHTTGVSIQKDKTVYAVGTDTNNYMGATFNSRGIMYYVVDNPSGKFQLATRKDGEPINTSIGGTVKYCVVKLGGDGKPLVETDDLLLTTPAGKGQYLEWSTEIKRVRFPFVVVTEPTSPEGNNGEPLPLGVYIDQGFIRNASITNAKISHAAITNAKISDLNAEKITAGLISADRIGAGTITANKINATNLAAIKAQLGTVTTGMIKSADNLMIIDFDNKYIRIDSGGA